MKTAEALRKLPKRILKEFVDSSSIFSTKKRQRQYQVLLALIDLIDKNEELNINVLIQNLGDFPSLPLLRKDLHEILESLLEYIAKQEIALKKINFQSQILAAVERYELNDLLEETYDKSLTILKNEEINSETLHDIFLIKKFGHERNRSISSITKKNNNKGLIELKQIQKQLTEYWEIESIKIGLLQYKIYNSNRSFDSAHLISPDFIQTCETENSLLLLYRSLYQLISTDSNSIDKINSLIDHLNNNPVHQLDFEIITDALSNLLNYYTNIGVPGLEKVRFSLIKTTVNRNRHKSSIETSIYRNYIYCACSVKEFDWALQFSEEYNSKLPIDERSTAYSFNKMRILWNMKDYEGVIETLRNVEYKDVTYNLNSKLALMTSFYELDEYEPLLSTIRAFKVFLRRRRNVSVARKANFTGFCDALYNIMLAEENRDIKRIRKAKEIIDGNPAIPNTGWLKEKIEELKL